MFGTRARNSFTGSICTASVVGLLIGILFGVVCTGCERIPDKVVLDSNAGGIENSASIVADLVLDFGDTEKRKISVEVNSPATVLSLLQAGTTQIGASLEYSGSSETAFVKSINGVANEGRNGKNWIFKINGELGDCSCGVAGIDDGDEVLWQLGSYNTEKKD